MFEIFSIEVQVSFFHLAGFVVVVSLCFLFNRQTLGLLSAFLFVFNWSTFANKEIILEVLKDDPYYWLVYIGGGAVMACLALALGLRWLLSRHGGIGFRSALAVFLVALTIMPLAANYSRASQRGMVATSVS